MKRTDAEEVRTWTGRSASPAKAWQLTENARGFELVTPGKRESFTGEALLHLEVKRHLWLWHSIGIRTGVNPLRLWVLRRRDVSGVRASIERQASRYRIVDDLAQVMAWHAHVRHTVQQAVTEGRWIPEETILELEKARPSAASLTGPRSSFVPLLTVPELSAVDFLSADVRAWIAATNDYILGQEQQTSKEFFKRIEESPLSEEQQHAVLKFDNRVNVIAAAGSGKTSVMVARAAYAVHRGFVKPERILMLAFNAEAAKELKRRVQERFSAVGLESNGIHASTFHSFGLKVMGAATGEKSRPAPWLTNGQDTGMVTRIVKELRKQSEMFRYTWDLFRLLYSAVGEEPDDGEVDEYDKSQRRSGYSTFGGDVVNSQGERLIANWLYLNHVEYEYETRYKHDVATSEHAQYRPDFYYPKIDTWHEHWALRADGTPPEEFHGYAQQMVWKRATHIEHGTDLIETNWHGIVYGDGFAELAHELKERGVILRWDPERAPSGKSATTDVQMVRLLRTFMTHVKSNSFTEASMHERFRSARSSLRGLRTRMFLTVYWMVHKEWDRRLHAEGYVDFEDMLVLAAHHLEAGHTTPEYDLILVDEFQDVSQARARLVRALVKERRKYLMTVGDDWQAINRFAGADISVMQDFETWFGTTQTMFLQTTYRCTQTICDVSSAFVSKNPDQIQKQVKSNQPGTGEPIKLLQVTSEDEAKDAVRKWLENLAASLPSKLLKEKNGAPVKVYILGRYRADKTITDGLQVSGLDVEFKTIHSSKGLEADYVVLPSLKRTYPTFPSQIADDPVLELAMTKAEAFPHSEERRLLYVALTRARKQVVIVGVEGAESVFLTELIKDKHIATSTGGAGEVRVCPECKKGTLVERNGPYGKFYACSTFPQCLHKQNSATTVSEIVSQRPQGPRCETCHEGRLVPRTSEYGDFYGCSRYPSCRHTQVSIW